MICNEGGNSPLSCVVPEEKTVDFYLANLTQQRLEQVKAQPKPFLQVVGHLKPHPFWGLPQWAFDLFPVDDVPLPAVGTYVSNMEREGVEPSFYACTSVNHRSELLNASVRIEPYNPLPPAIVKKARQGYFAGVAHLDRMVGSVLDKVGGSPVGSRLCPCV